MTGQTGDPGAQLWAAMSSAQYGIFRLETLQSYNEPEERAALEAFLAGHRAETEASNPAAAGRHPYMDELCSALDRGCRFGRVHVAVEPLSDYLRFELEAYEPNVRAGDDVRILPVGANRPLREWPEDIPRRDFWLIDSSVLLEVVYNDQNTWTGLTPVTDPGRVHAACQVRDTAWRNAVRWSDYVAERIELHAS